MVGEGMLMNDPNLMMVRGEASNAEADDIARQTDMADQVAGYQLEILRQLQSESNDPLDFMSLVDPERTLDAMTRSQLSDFIHSGGNKPIAGSFLSKIGSLGHRAIEHIKRSKGVKRLMMAAVPKIMDLVAAKLGVSEQNKARMKALA